MVYSKVEQEAIKQLHSRLRQAMAEYENVDFDTVRDKLLEYDVIHSHIKRLRDACKDAWEQIIGIGWVEFKESGDVPK